MASSSSSPSLKYDLFLSFRGEDTRDNIVSNVLKALRTSKIQTFINDGLNTGDEISAALIGAIEGSKISVIILSKSYAESGWCLDQLLKILECRKKLNQIVIPLFYKVYPFDVRSLTGEFGTAFLKNIAASKSGKEQIWRDALKEAADLSGLHSSNFRSEATLVDTIVDQVLEKLEMGAHNSYDDMGLVGIKSPKEEIMGLLNVESPEFGMVGIWGMGGIGKTTIAEALFNKFSCKFESCCFLSNIREKAKNEGLPSMRDNLISVLLKDDILKIHTPNIGDASIKEKKEIPTPYIGNAFTDNRLRRIRVLVVLDDVDDSLQLEGLIGERGTNPFGLGSRVIVTTRDKQVLNAHDITDVYEMKLLHDDEALQLFFYHALRPNQLAEPYQEFSKKVVEYAKGFPLALKVLGSSLRGKTDLLHWEGALRKLKSVPHIRISDVFKISYDSLEDEEKDIFFDIACFFKGTSFDTVSNVLEGCYISLHLGIATLIDKSLINISQRNISIGDMTAKASFDRVEMHELVQKMGWNIVVTRESIEVGSLRRLWRREDVSDVLTKNTGTERIKSIFLDVTEGNEMKLDPEAFENMYNLKFLKIMDPTSNIQFPSGLNSLPNGLKYLYWQNYPLEYLPPINAKNLVELHIDGGHLKQLWTERQNLCNLKALCLHFCTKLIEIPDLLLASKLEELRVTSCESLEEISLSLPLKKLDVSNCSKLKHLPNGVLFLSHLNLNGCPKIIRLPYWSKNIRYLEVNGTLVEKDQSSLQQFIQLVSLVLWDCTVYQKSSAFLQKIKAGTPSNCQITFCETEPRYSFLDG